MDKAAVKTNITGNMTKVFGLRPGNAKDEKLAALLKNARTSCVERFIYCRGLCALYVGGMYLTSVEEMGTGKHWLDDAADRLPELPHLKTWAAKLP